VTRTSREWPGPVIIGGVDFADATSVTDIPLVRVLGVVIGGLLLIAAIRAMFGGGGRGGGRGGRRR
jgi:hypothetical protein